MTGFYEGTGNEAPLTPHAIEEHTDVTVQNPKDDGDILQWSENVQRWENKPLDVSQALNDLTDVTTPSPSDGQVLSYSSGTGEWVAGNPSGTGAVNLPDLLDVTVSGQTTGQVLTWNGSIWENLDNVAGTVASLDDIGDVTITSVSNGDRLEWSGTEWINVPNTQSANPVTIGTGVNGTSAGVIMNAGGNDLDFAYVSFQHNDTTEFQIVGQEVGGVPQLEIVTSGSNRILIDLDANVYADGSVSAGGQLNSGSLTGQNNVLASGSLGIITETSFAPDDVVLKTGAQTIAGEKTFTDTMVTQALSVQGNLAIVAPAASSSDAFVLRNGLGIITNTGVAFSEMVQVAATQTITGPKTFNQTISIGNGINGSGTIQTTGNLAAVYPAISSGFFALGSNISGLIGYNSSDERLKDDIRPTTYTLGHVQALMIADYEWKEDGVTDVGFIAQNVEEFIPHAARYFEEQDTYGLNDRVLLAVAYKAIQELAERVEELEDGV